MSELSEERELDARVAEKVMGWAVEHDALGESHSTGYGCPPTGEEPPDHPPVFSLGKRGNAYCIPPYSTDIAAAWQVVEKVLVHPCRTFGIIFDEATDTWIVKFDKTRCVFNDCRISAQEETAPLAICRAALAAVHAA